MKNLLKNIKESQLSKISIGVTILFIIILVFSLMNQHHLQAISDHVTIEYGTEISLDPFDYLDLEDIDEVDRNDFLEKVNVIVNAENNKPEVGHYDVILSYEDEEVKVAVDVVDTTAPVFTQDFPEHIKYTKDCQPQKDQLISQFKATDLSDTTITVDDSTVDYTKTGNYKALVKAEDNYGNKAEKEVTINVVEPTIQINHEKETIYVESQYIIQTKITGKEKEATYQSSDTKIVTVDKNGKVTGKRKGSATITVSANGIKKTAKVTVKAKPVNAKMTTKKDPKGNTITIVEKDKTNGTSASISYDAISLINKERSKRGLSALTYSASLGEVAKKRTKEFLAEVETGTVHKGFYKYYPDYSATECAHFGSSNASGAVQAWMNSAGHRDALMRDYRTKIAVARYGVYWIAIIQ